MGDDQTPRMVGRRRDDQAAARDVADSHAGGARRELRDSDGDRHRRAPTGHRERLRSLIRSRGGLRDAVVLRELLGPPKSLEGRWPW